ncbi:MAG TPA: rhodanese-like domain-containing protein [Anaerolineales bacterium]
MIFERVESDGLAHFSYLIGDEYAGVAAVIDPRRDVEVYLELAREKHARITYILETHIHADFVSGSRELAGRTGAPIGVGATAQVGFEHQPLADGDQIEVGRLSLQVLHTPGHTPEHVCFLVRGGAGAERPWGLFSGDSLFAGEVGRPDLLGEGTEEKLARQLFHTLNEIVLPVGDEVILYPAHGEGSPCGANIGDRDTSTIGYERQNNPLLSIEDEDEFVERVLAALEPAPSYYGRMKVTNTQGAPVLGLWPDLQPMDASDFREAMSQPDSVVIDTREIEGFGGAHIKGAINIPLREIFPIWAGRILDESFPIWAGRMIGPEARILLVLPDADRVDVVVGHLMRLGYERLRGYVRQGMRGWIEAGLPFERLPQMSVHELRARIQRGDDLQVLDVRSDSEWQEGHIPTARHIYVPDLNENLDQIDRSRPVATYCGSGYRASIAASILEQNGFSQVYNVPGSMTAWKEAGYPLEG